MTLPDLCPCGHEIDEHTHLGCTHCNCPHIRVFDSGNVRKRWFLSGDATPVAYAQQEPERD